jgi:hypothetical protein
MTLGLATIGAVICGLDGLALGLLMAGCIEACIMAPTVFRTVTSVGKPPLIAARLPEGPERPTP